MLLVQIMQKRCHRPGLRIGVTFREACGNKLRIRSCQKDKGDAVMDQGVCNNKRRVVLDPDIKNGGLHQAGELDCLMNISKRSYDRIPFGTNFS